MSSAVERESPVAYHSDASESPGGRQGRILVVAPQPFYQDRGTPIALRQVLEALSELGYRVDLLTYPIGQDIELPGLRIIRAGNPFGISQVPIGLSGRKLLLDLSLVAALRSCLRQERYSCIHALEEAAFPALVLGRRWGVPLLYDMQSSLPEQLLQYWLLRLAPLRWGLEAAERWLLRRAHFVVSSAGLADRVGRLAPETPVHEWHFASLPPTVDPAEAHALRRQLDIGASDPVVLYSGTFETYQGLDQLIGAIPEVLTRIPRTTFVLVGGNRANSLARDATVAPLITGGALRLIDRQPRGVMAVYHAMADVLVSPRAFGGNLPLKIFDYLAAGRPIVATDIPTHRTVLGEDRAVLVAPESRAIAKGILSLLRDSGLATRIAQGAAQYAHEHLRREAFVRNLAELYDRFHRHAQRP